jgi:hypothetical protein
MLFELDFRFFEENDDEDVDEDEDDEDDEEDEEDDDDDDDADLFLGVLFLLEADLLAPPTQAIPAPLFSGTLAGTGATAGATFLAICAKCNN